MVPRVASFASCWKIDLEGENELLRLTYSESGRDTAISFGIPLHALPSLSLTVRRYLDRYPELFDEITTISQSK